MLPLEDHYELLKSFVPQFLTQEDQKELIKEIDNTFPFSSDASKMYTQLDEDEFYFQGDGIIDIPFSRFNIDGENFSTEYYDGIILSNTCDISTENAPSRLSEPFVNLAVIIPLNEYLEGLKETGINEDRILNFIRDLKSNHISNLFYLPSISEGDEQFFKDSFVRLDYMVSLPLSLLTSDKFDRRYQVTGDRIFSFSNYGFYLFIFKLSVHFNRIRDGVFRNQSHFDS